MVKIVDGNLMCSKTDIIAHQVNCRGAFNSGVAREIREFDPTVYADYREYCVGKTPNKLLGTVKYFKSNSGRIYANLFAQASYGYDGKQYTDINALRKCFENLRDYSIRENLTVAMPYKIGSVRGGAKWEEVYEIIEEVFKDCVVELWRLDRG